MGSSSQPPSPSGVPLLGNGLAFSRAPFEAVREWASLGDLVELRFPGRRLYMVTGPALIESVLVDRQEAFTIGRPQRETFRGVEDDAVTATSGDRWRRLRRALHPAFTWDGIQRYGDRMGDRAATHIERWSAGDRIDLLREMRLLTLRILGDTLLGVDMAGREAVVLAAADALVDRSDPRRPGQLLPEWIPTPTRRRFERAIGRLDSFVDGVLEDSAAGEAHVGRVLLAAESAGELSMAEVRDNLTALLLAGHDSTALTLTYAWYELSRHPDALEAVANEATQVLGEEPADATDFDALEHTRRVIRETLRLYPPAWAVNREVSQRVTLDGYDLSPGDQLILPQWVVHRDERFWIDPDTFDPARWAADRERPEYAYFPFSGGPRHCIGMRFARFELTLALATMAQRVALDVEVSGELTFAPALSLRPEAELTATVRRPHPG